MIIPDRPRPWWPGYEIDTSRLVNSATRPWLVSFVAHALILVTLGLWPRVEPILASRVTLVSLDDSDVELEPPEIYVESPIDYQEFDERLPEIGTPSEGLVELAAPPPIGQDLMPLDAAESETPSAGADQMTLAEMFADDGDALLEELTGIRGAVVDVRGDVGSVERITIEILKLREKDKVLVVWLMDASESLRGRREEIIQHFDRVYEELDMLADGKSKPLLTSVAAFGQGLVPMMAKPTNDREEIQQSVRQIEADESGVENVFSAIRVSALACKKFTRSGWKVMLVVVTDEKGNDLSVLDDALALVNRQRISVCVMGPFAPFGNQQIRVKWTDQDSGKMFFLPVDRGPESAQVEHAGLAVWDHGPGSQVLFSGFGPFGLTRLTHENGGLYLLHDDGAIRGPTFDVDAMSRYRPDYVTLVEYERMARNHPLRVAVMRTAQASNQLLDKRLPMIFLAAGIQFEIRSVKQYLDRVTEVVARGLNELHSVEKLRDKETSPRWRAHYDLLMGRLLANRVRCVSYGQLLEAMYVNPRVPEDGVKNAWKLVHDKSKADANDEDGKLARQYLQRVIDEHADTPWGVIAERELKFPLAFQWQAVFMDPPKGVPLPWDRIPWKQLTEAQKVAKAGFDQRTQRAQQRQQQRAVDGSQAKRRPPPKL